MLYKASVDWVDSGVKRICELIFLGQAIFGVYIFQISLQNVKYNFNLFYLKYTLDTLDENNNEFRIKLQQL